MIHVVVIRVVDAAAVRRASRWRTAAITGLVVVFAGFAWALAMLPPFVGFLFAVGAAVGWCVWLEKCLEADTVVEPGRPRGHRIGRGVVTEYVRRSAAQTVSTSRNGTGPALDSAASPANAKPGWTASP